MNKILSIFSSPVKSFILIALIFGSLIIFLQPPLTVGDEEAHFVRAYGISEGNIRLYNTNQVQVPKSFRITIGCFQYKKPVAGRMYTYKHKIYGVDKKKEFQCSLTVPLNRTMTEYVRTSATGYSPTTYIPQVLAISIGKIFNLPIVAMIYLVRIFTMIAYVGMITFAIKLLPISKWSLVGVGLLPVSMVQLVNPGGDYMLFGTIAIFTSVIVRSMYIPKRELHQQNRKLLITLMVTAGLMVLPKGVFPGICFLPLLIFYGGVKYARVAKIGIFISALLIAFTWQVFGVSTVLGRQNTHVNSVFAFPAAFFKTMFYSWTNTDFLQIGRSSGASGSIPSLIITVINMLVALYIFVGYPEKRRLTVNIAELKLIRLAIILVTTLVVVGSFGALFIAGSYLQNSGSGVINGVQTRYFYPALFALSIVPFWKIALTKKEDIYRRLVICGTTVLLSTQVIAICIYYQWGIF